MTEERLHAQADMPRTAFSFRGDAPSLAESFSDPDLHAGILYLATVDTGA